MDIMKLYYTTLFALFLASDCISATSKIKYVFIDINALIAPSTTAASKIIGIINSMKFTALLGKIPSQADFFKALSEVPACTTQTTYHENNSMPCILCDWLLGLQTNQKIKLLIYEHLEKSSITDIEKTIYKNITSMMMSPSIFIDTQYIIKDLSKIIHSLKKNGYNVIIIGNWDKESEPLLFKLLNGHNLPDQKHSYFSYRSEYLKPNPKYFTKLLQHFSTKSHMITPEECVIIDVEKNHAIAARSHGFHSILLHGHNASQLKSELSRINIKL